MTARSQERLIERAVQARVWAVVGASNNRHKFGNIIYRDMRRGGYTVYPVNPGCAMVEGDRAYPSLSSLPRTPLVADIVVPPSAGHQVAEDAARAGVEIFWLQPGAETDELIAYATSLGLLVIHHACAMVARRLHN